MIEQSVSIIGMAGTSPAMTSIMLVLSTARHRHFPDSIFKQHARVGFAPFAPMKDERDSSRASSREVSFSSAPQKARGMERREAHLVSFRFRHRVRSDGLRRRIALRRSIAAILGEGTVLPGADGGATRPLIRTAFAAFIRTASSRERQSHVVGPDGDPSLPGSVFARHTRRRRILLRFKAPSRSAPHEQDMPNLSVVRSTGIAIPITKCCRRRGPDEVAPSPRRANFPPSFRGARLRANPESTATQEIFAVMDSGPAPRGASRNDIASIEHGNALYQYL